MKPRKSLAVIFLVSALVSAAHARADPASTHIAIVDFAFEPSEQTISTGEPITWQNDGQEPHNVIDADGAWESPALANGQTYTFTFSTPGTYTYFCSIHSGMLGTITVADALPPPHTKVYLPAIQR
jgi:plastocyanin